MPHTFITYATFLARLQDRWEGVPFWTLADAKDAINEALRVWAMLTGAWKQRVVVPTIPNDPFISLPGLLTYRMRLEWAGYPLSSSSLSDLDNGRIDWQTETTASGGDVPATVQLWAPAGLTLLVIWPADAVGGNPLVVDGLSVLDEVDVGSTIDLGDEDFHVLVGYALHVCAFREGGPRWRATQNYYQDFLMAAGQRNDALRRLAWYRRLMGLDRRPLAAQPAAGGSSVRDGSLGAGLTSAPGA